MKCCRHLNHNGTVTHQTTHSGRATLGLRYIILKTNRMTYTQLMQALMRGQQPRNTCSPLVLLSPPTAFLSSSPSGMYPRALLANYLQYACSSIYKLLSIKFLYHLFHSTHPMLASPTEARTGKSRQRLRWVAATNPSLQRDKLRPLPACKVKQRNRNPHR